MTNDKNNESLLTFPCDFTIKVFGKAGDAFEAEVFSIVHRIVPNFSDRQIKSHLSENGKYNALNITIHVESKDQLDTIYQALTKSPHVLMAL